MWAGLAGGAGCRGWVRGARRSALAHRRPASQLAVATNSPLSAHRCTNPSDHYATCAKVRAYYLIKQISSRHPNNCREGSAAATGAPSISGTCPTLICTRNKLAKSSEITGTDAPAAIRRQCQSAGDSRRASLCHLCAAGVRT